MFLLTLFLSTGNFYLFFGSTYLFHVNIVCCDFNMSLARSVSIAKHFSSVMFPSSLSGQISPRYSTLVCTNYHRIFFNKLCINTSFQLCVDKNIFTTAKSLKFQDIVTQQMSFYFKQQNALDALKEDSLHIELSEAEQDQLIPKYLISIATDPEVNHENILKIFQLYASSHRPLMQEKIDFPQQFNALLPVAEQSLKYMTFSELKQLGASLSAIRNQKLSLVNSLINSLCQECSARLNAQNISLSLSIQYFEVIFEIYGNGITGKDYYETFLDLFLSGLNEANDKELLQIMLYSTLSQKHAHLELVNNCMKKIDSTIDSIPLVACGIMANSLIRSGMKLDAQMPILPKMIKKLINEMNSKSSRSVLDVLSIASIVELLRLSRYFKDQKLIEAIETFILKCNDDYLDDNTLPQFVAFLANQNYNKEAFTKVENILMEKLQDDTGTFIPLASMARIMWAFSTCDHRCSRQFVELLFGDLHSQVASQKTQTNFLKFTDIITSLAIMGHYDYDLCEEVFAPFRGRGYAGMLIILVPLIFWLLITVFIS